MADRKTFEGSADQLSDHEVVRRRGLMVNLAARPDTTKTMKVVFSLDTPADQTAQLEAAVAQGRVLPRETIARFGADPAAAAQLEAWLKAEGFQIEKVSADHTSVYALAPISTIEQSLQVHMVPVVKDGVTYISADGPPSLPADIGASVRAIAGLQPYRRINKHFRQLLAPENLNPEPAINFAPPYLPREILTAYGAASLNLTGQGQTIAILIDTFPNASDLQAFWKAAGVSVTMAQIAEINVSGGTTPAPSGEETLDASWSSSIAPGANIRIYAAGELSFPAIDAALDAIVADLPTYPSLCQLSISLGLGETYMVKDEVQTQHAKFLKLAAAGVNVFVSTGDAGSNPDQTGHSSNGPLQAEYESTDTAVIAVGGTSLTLNSDGSIASEIAWASGGGGRSVLFSRQAWQTGNGVPSGTDRLVPDVASAADPNTGAFLVLNGSTLTIGGTSWSAPTWAGICALINQARIAAGQPALPYLGPLIYPLNGAAAFHDITQGSNGAYRAGPGYDLCTGLGAPNVAALVQALTRVPAVAPPAPASAH
jgi:kumamolisin